MASGKCGPLRGGDRGARIDDAGGKSGQATLVPNRQAGAGYFELPGERIEPRLPVDGHVYLPVKFGGRFSKNDAMPSLKSAERNSGSNCRNTWCT